MSVLKDLVGKRFGWLVVTERGPNNSGNRAQWVCLCACGKQHLVTTARLNNGNTVSCGCKRARGNTKYGRKFKPYVWGLEDDSHD
jgi:hypothetical protein